MIDPPSLDGALSIMEDPRLVAMPFEIDGDRLRIALDDDRQAIESARIVE